MRDTLLVLPILRLQIIRIECLYNLQRRSRQPAVVHTSSDGDFLTEIP